MQGVYLKLYMSQNARHRDKLAYEWVLEKAHKLGIKGGSVFRAIAGFGRHGRIHEEHFFELADDLPVSVEFATGSDEAHRLLDMIAAERINVFYVLHQAEYGSF
ncbi:uncharacterized protein NMK_0501 [Novimethylophilus kurashikiensis]|uniref:Uncharacterized protein n=2 Tax=Novimethylophilus kurashikiensis TaxID=1825523 RepID=A0A2R5F8K5_9PROT|nr:uncharacterized protein NMK_0501 [Novimethylophilus kurashikiensis]